MVYMILFTFLLTFLPKGYSIFAVDDINIIP